MPATGTIPASAGNGNNATSLDALTVDVRDFGAVAEYGAPGKGTGRDNLAAFNAARDYVIAQGLNSQNDRRMGYIYVPSSIYPYRISSTFLLGSPYLGIRGDGPGQTKIVCDEGPNILVGMRETESAQGGGTLALDASFRPTRTGILDGTFGGHGWRLNKATLLFSGCPLTNGPIVGGVRSNWKGVSQFTVEIAIRRQDGGVWPGGSLSGIWQFGATSIGSGFGSFPPIFNLQKGGNTNGFDLTLTDSGGNAGTVGVSAGAATGLIKLCFQIDLTTKTAIAFVNGVQVAATLGGAAFGGSGTGALYGNDMSAFIFGVDTQTATNMAPVQVASPPQMVDFTVYGFSCSANLRYHDDGVGQPQRRRDGRTVNDESRFGPAGYQDTGLVCCLLGDDTTGSTATDRRVRALTRDTFHTYHGHFIQTAQYLVQGGVKHNVIKDLCLMQTRSTSAVVLAVGATLELRVKNVMIRGGLAAVWGLPLLANYFNFYEDLDVGGQGDCAIQVNNSDSKFVNLTIENAGRVPVRAWASNLEIDTLRLGFASNYVERLIQQFGGLYGGLYRYRGLFYDFEGETCAGAPFYFEQHSNLNTLVDIDVVYLGSSANGRPVFELRSAQNQAQKCKIRAANIDTAGSGYSAPSLVWGSGWKGSIELSNNNGTPPVFQPINGSTNNVSVVY